jgi:23S rRNA (guanosine2251-2'-O)-methyltransferase
MNKRPSFSRPKPSRSTPSTEKSFEKTKQSYGTKRSNTASVSQGGERPRYSSFANSTTASKSRPAKERIEPATPDFSDIEGAHYLFGRHAVLELLEQNPKRVQKLFVAERAGRDKRLDKIISLCEGNGIRWIQVPRQKIDNIVKYHAETFGEEDETYNPASAQGVAVMVTAQPLLELSELITNAQTYSTQLVIALDEVTDARNIGAILRVADAVGACGVLLPKHRSGGLSPLASKTAVGADQYVPIAQVTNLGNALNELKEAGYWTVATLCETGEDAHAVQHYQTVKYDVPIVLVVGSEDKGVRPSLAKHCDFRVNIPMFGQVDSLNVSTATAVLAYEIIQQQRRNLDRNVEGKVSLLS